MNVSHPNYISKSKFTHEHHNKRGQNIRDAAFLIISGGKVKSRTAKRQDDIEVLTEISRMLYHRVIIKQH